MDPNQILFSFDQIIPKMYNLVEIFFLDFFILSVFYNAIFFCYFPYDLGFFYLISKRINNINHLFTTTRIQIQDGLNDMDPTRPRYGSESWSQALIKPFTPDT